jgi:hypothetical protein
MLEINLRWYLGPWIKTSNERYVRKLLVSSFYIYVRLNYYGWANSVSIEKDFKTAEAAMEDADKALIEEGYMLLTEEQFNKLQVLL